jgi:hypothetical protein
MKMYEVDVLVTGTRREIYHITAASEEAAREEALWGCVHPVNDNYRTDVHHREVWEVTEMKGEKA